MTAEVSSQGGSLSDPLPRVPSPEVDFVGGTNPRLFTQGKHFCSLLPCHVQMTQRQIYIYIISNLMTLFESSCLG